MLNRICFIGVILFVFGCKTSYGQNTDSLFTVAQQSAYSKQYQKAESICRQIIALAPAATEYQVFLGRVFAWQEKTDSAKAVLKRVIDREPHNVDAYDALTDAELWSKDYKQVIAHCMLIVPHATGAQKEALLLKQAKACYLLDDAAGAQKILNELLISSPGNKEARNLLNEINSKAWKNSVSVSYLNVSFSNPVFPSWHFAYLEYMRNIKKCPLLGRFNYGNAFGVNGYQLEVDAYPKFGKSTYAYLNGGYSSLTDVFPAARAGAEVYQKLPYAFEISGGARFLHFEHENVFIYTASLGKYYKNFWIAYRPYIVNKVSDVFVSHTGIIRCYFSDPDNYISLNLIYGATPYTTYSLADITKVNSQRIGIDFQYKFPKNFLIKPMFSYEYEEYFPGLFRNRFYSQLTLSKRF